VPFVGLSVSYGSVQEKVSMLLLLAWGGCPDKILLKSSHPKFFYYVEVGEPTVLVPVDAKFYRSRKERKCP